MFLWRPGLWRVWLHHQVKLTWDETDHERVSALNRKFNKDELLQMDFNAYLASSSDEEEEDEDGDDRDAAEGEKDDL